MTTPNTLRSTTILVNLILWISYLMVGIQPGDFGETPKYLHAYMLICAFIAYIANLAYVFIVAAKGVHSSTITVVTACVLFY